MIWLSSDTHFCHKRDFLWAPRGFHSASEMNKEIIARWNSKVERDDDVYLLGDVMLNDNQQGMECLRALNGNIHICIGNHDTDDRIKLYLNSAPNVESVEFAYRFRYYNQSFYATHYPTLCGNFDDGRSLRRCTLNLCGHSHTKDPFADWERGAIYHCELDAHNCYPVTLEQILDDCSKRLK